MAVSKSARTEPGKRFYRVKVRAKACQSLRTR